MRQNYRKDERSADVSKKETIRRILDYSSDYRGPVIWISFLAVAGSFSKALVPVFTKKAIDEDILSGNMNGLLRTVSAALALSLFWGLCAVIRDRMTNRMANDIVYRARTETYANILSLPLSFFDSRPAGRIITRVISDCDKLKEITKSLTSSLIPSLVFLLSAMVIMTMMNPLLALSSFIIIPLLVLMSYFIVIRGYQNWETFRKKESNFSSFVHEDYSGIRTIQSFGAEKESEKECKRLLCECYSSWMKAIRRSDFFGVIITLSQALGYVFLLLCAVLWLPRGESTVGEILAFITYIGYFWQPIRSLASLYNTIINNMAAAARVFEMMDEKSDITECEDAVSLVSGRGDVEFRSVTFSYPDEEEKNVIENLSFRIKGGETIALVGPTGAGKTTIINLLARFYDPVKGEILIDGQDIRRVTFSSLRSLVAVMPQDGMLFSGTIRDNLLYGKEVSDEEMKACVARLNLTSFMESLPNGYDTDVKDICLSSGQRQLVALARTMIRDPKILVLDEATSNVDTRTEMMVQKGLKILMNGRTCFIVAHRLSTVRNADEIFFVDGRTIMEKGTHETLMKKENGEYRRLYLAQFASMED